MVTGTVALNTRTFVFRAVREEAGEPARETRASDWAELGRRVLAEAARRSPTAAVEHAHAGASLQCGAGIGEPS